jgi:uncharacterized metal-binding protein YceD (DUF177 family)
MAGRVTISPEFSRLVRLDTLGAEPRTVAVEADAAERGALAVRFDLIAIDRLEASAECVRDGDTIDVTGALSGDLVQSCVASGEPVPARIAERFRLRFVPAPSLDSEAEEIELSEDDCDVVPYSGGAIDLGEAVAETLALALNPFPRSPKATEALRLAGVLSEEDAGPFAALKELKDKLTKG